MAKPARGRFSREFKERTVARPAMSRAICTRVAVELDVIVGQGEIRDWEHMAEDIF